MKQFRTDLERQAASRIEEIFLANPDSVQIKLENFPKYVRRQHLKRFLAMYEIFKKALPVKGSVVECGVFRGFGIMSWAKLSAILEPENLTRRIYGFDTFDGFPEVSELDQSQFHSVKQGGLKANSFDELEALIAQYDADRFLGHIGKVELIRGDMVQTIPEFIASHQHLLVSLLFVDCDLYEATRIALEHFIPRMPKGAILAFDDLDNPIWPGETRALLDKLGVSRLRIQRIEWDPYIGFAILD